jgi:WD40 repeat protein
LLVLVPNKGRENTSDKPERSMTRTHACYAVALLLLSSVAGDAHGQTPAKLDVHGDPLPAGAIARLGTVRWRHADGASFVAFLPDGKSVLSAGGDGMARIWDVASGKELRRFGTGRAFATAGHLPFRAFAMVALDDGEDLGPQAISVSADGKLLAARASSTTVRLCDVATGKEIRQITVKDTCVTGTALTRDGKSLLIQTMDGKFRLHATETGKEIKQFGEEIDPNNPMNYFSTALAPDGKLLATVKMNAMGKMELTIWDTAEGKILSRISGKNQAVDFMGLEYSPDGKSLAWITHDQRIVLAEPKTAKEVRRLRFGFFARSFGGFTFTPDSKMVLAWERPGGQFHFWDTSDGKHVRSLKGPATGGPEWENNEPSMVAVSQDGKLLARAMPNGPISILDMAKGTEQHSPDAHRRPITRVAFDRDGKQVVTMDDGLRLRSWQTDPGKSLRAIPTPRNRAVTGLADDGRYLLVRGVRDAVSLVETASGKEARTIATGLDSVSTPTLSPDNKHLAVVGMKAKKGVIGVYDVATGKETRQFALPEQVIQEDAPPPVPLPPGIAIDFAGNAGTGSVLFSPDGRIMAIMLQNQRIALWDVTTGRELPIIEAPKDHAIRSAAFSPDGKSLAMDCEDGAPRLYETATGHERRSYENAKPGAPITRDEDVIVGGLARTIDEMVIGGLAQGEIAVSPNGRLIAHCRQGGVIAVWDIAAKKELGQLKGHQADVNTLAFSADGKVLASGSRDTTVLLWDMAKYLAAAKPQAAKLDPASRWNDLVGTDAARAFDALCSFAAAPETTTAFLKDHIRPAAPADADKVERLIADLDSPRFAERKQAAVELEKIGESAIPLLRKALEAEPTAEARKRMEELLKKTDSGAPRGELLRSLRVVEVLETISTPEAKSVLQALAKGTADASLTRAAQAALERLGR